MARVNVEQKALTDARFGRLGLLLVESEYPGITMDSAMCLGLGRMLRIWNECQERFSYTLTDDDVAVLLGHRDGARLLIDAGLAQRARRGHVRIRGAEGRVEWLHARRENAKRGGENSMAKLTPEERRNKAKAAASTRWASIDDAEHNADYSEHPVSIDAEHPMPTNADAPAPAPAPTEEEKKKTPSESKKKSSAKELVEGFVLSPELIAEAARKYPLVDDVEAETALWLDRLRANGYRTNAGPVKDAAAAWRYWMGNAQKFKARASPRAATPPLFRRVEKQE